MGAALAVAVAVARPDEVERLVLVAPAGLPLTKPIPASLRDFARQVGSGLYGPRELVRGIGDGLRAPLMTLRLARAIRLLDLTEELRALRRLRVPCEVVACRTDTLTPVDHCRRIAQLAGARYTELDVPGGHMWMLSARDAFARILAA